MWSEKLPSGKVRFVERYEDPSSDITKRIYLHITKRQKEKDQEQLKDVQIL